MIRGLLRYDFLGKWVASPAVRFGLCRKAKAGSGPSPTKAVGRKQIYFEGAVAVLRAVLDADEAAAAAKPAREASAEAAQLHRTLAAETAEAGDAVGAAHHRALVAEAEAVGAGLATPWDPVPLHCGRLPVDYSKYAKLLKTPQHSMQTLQQQEKGPSEKRNEPTMPHFLRTPLDRLRCVIPFRSIKLLYLPLSCCSSTLISMRRLHTAYWGGCSLLFACWQVCRAAAQGSTAQRHHLHGGGPPPSVRARSGERGRAGSQNGSIRPRDSQGDCTGRNGGCFGGGRCRSGGDPSGCRLFNIIVAAAVVNTKETG